LKVDHDETYQAKAVRPTPDSQSLLSISPSEPGIAALSVSSSVGTHSDQTLDDAPCDRDDYRSVATSSTRTTLSPTSSLPNLPYFQYTPGAAHLRSGEQEDGAGAWHAGMPTQPPSHFRVSTTSATSGDSKLVRFADQNNCNNSGHARLSQSPLIAVASPRSQDYFNYGTTGHAKNLETKEFTANMTASASVGRIPVQRHQPLVTADVSDANPSKPKMRSVDMVTSYLYQQTLSSTETGNLRRIIAEKAIGRSDHRPHAPTPFLDNRSTPPRVRGRRERQGTSRYSYLQAVNDLSHTDV